MDAESRAILDEIVSRPIGSMSDTERAFVRARRDYLTEAQRKDLAPVLEEEVTTEEDEDEDNAPDYSKLKKAELEALCVERGIEVPSGSTNADKVALLEASDEEEDEEETEA